MTLSGRSNSSRSTNAPLSRSNHFTVQDAVFEVVGRRSLEAEAGVKALQVSLGGDFDRHLAVASCDVIEAFMHQPLPKTRAAITGRGHDPTESGGSTGLVGRKNTHTAREVITITPSEKMVGVLIPAVRVQIDA